MGLREEILACEDRKELRKVEVPEWGKTVYIRVISGAERDSFEEQGLVKKGKSYSATLRNIRARLLVLCCCDETGAPIFQPTDAEALGQKSGAALDRLFSVAQALNKFTEEDIEEIAKN